MRVTHTLDCALKLSPLKQIVYSPNLTTFPIFSLIRISQNALNPCAI